MAEENTAVNDAGGDSGSPTLDPSKIAGNTPQEGAGAQTDTTGDESAGAPESYGELNVPEGAEFSDGYVEALKTWGKENGLTQEDLQKVVDFQSQQQKDSLAAVNAEWTKVNKEWQEAVQNDPEIGGAKFEQNMALANKVITTFAANPEHVKEISEAFKLTGAGNHPALVKLFIRMGHAISESKPVQGRVSPESEQSLAKRLFPNMN